MIAHICLLALSLVGGQTVSGIGSEIRPTGVAAFVDPDGDDDPVASDSLISGPDLTLAGPQPGSGFGIGLTTAGDVNGDGYGDLFVGAPEFDGAFVDEGRAYLYLGTPDGLSLDASWTYDGGQAGASLGSSVGFAGDVNGDGFSDLLVGAPGFDTGFTDAGVVLLFLGSPGGPANTPDWQLDGFQADLELSVACTAGDVNGDDYDDVIVGAALYDGGFTDEGLAQVHYGSASGPSATPAWSVTGGGSGVLLGFSVAAAGDVDGDGFGDVLVGAPGFGGAGVGGAVYFPGSPTGPSLAPTWSTAASTFGGEVGTCVSTAGDVNGDGLADILVGAPSAPTGMFGTTTGTAYVWLGTPSGPETFSNWMVFGNLSGERRGQSVASAGDMNGDGLGEVIVGSPFVTNVLSERGLVSVHLGDPFGVEVFPLWDEYGGAVGEHFGSTVACAGDLNGDGFGDVAAAASDVDLVRVFLGGGEPFRDRVGGGNFDATSAQDFENLGASVAGAGDVNGDGLDDVLVGAPGWDGGFTDEGRGLLYLSPLDVTTTLAWSVEGGQDGAQTGECVAGAGDVNGDGFDDVLVGSPFWDGAFADEGKVELFLGAETGPSPTPAWTVTGGEDTAKLGIGVASAGDLNGDGFADVAVGATRFDGGNPRPGRVDVYLGSSGGLSGTPVRTYLGAQMNDRFGGGVASAGDVDGDGFDDLLVGASRHDPPGLVAAGRAYLYRGGPTGPEPGAAWTVDGDVAGGHFGRGIGGAGDVDGDGYDDVVVGAPDRVVSFNTGALFLYHGSPTGLGAGSVVDQGSGRLGFACGTAGDVNADGFADIVAGQPGQREALVYYGSSGGLISPGTYVSSLYFALSGGQKPGHAAAWAGDVNGDGFSDVIVGDPEFANVTTTLVDAGRAQVYKGNRVFDSFNMPQTGILLRPRQLRLSGDSLSPGGRADSPRRFVVEVDLVRAPAGLLWAAPGPVNARLEVELKPLGEPYDGQGTQLSSPVQLTVGVPVTFSMQVEREGPLGAPYRWRARVVFEGNPLAPVTHWITDRGTSMNDAMVRFQDVQVEARGLQPR